MTVNLATLEAQKLEKRIEALEQRLEQHMAELRRQIEQCAVASSQREGK